MKVRKATHADIPVIVNMSYDMAQESPFYRQAKFDKRLMAAFTEDMIDNPDIFCVFLAENEKGEVVGMFGGQISPFFFSFDSQYSCDIGIYVVPEARGTRAALLLEQAYADWAKARGIPEHFIRVGVSTMTNDEALDRFYTRRGYKCCGRMYVKG